MQVELGGGRQLPERRRTLDVPTKKPISNGRSSPIGYRPAVPTYYAIIQVGGDYGSTHKEH